MPMVQQVESSRIAPRPKWLDAGRGIARELSRFPPLHAVVVSAREWRDRAIDRSLGIDTRPPLNTKSNPATRFGDSVWYEATDYALLQQYMRPLRLDAADVAYDIGCGVGRTVCTFARRQIAKCIGIEVVPELAGIARTNAVTLRGPHSPIEIITTDAAEADYSDGTIFWFNNPFGAQTMAAVIAQIERSLLDRPRPIQLAYVFPFHEDVLQASGWLRCVHRERPMLNSSSEASYWTND